MHLDSLLIALPTSSNPLTQAIQQAHTHLYVFCQWGAESIFSIIKHGIMDRLVVHMWMKSMLCNIMYAENKMKSLLNKINYNKVLDFILISPHPRK